MRAESISRRRQSAHGKQRGQLIPTAIRSPPPEGKLLSGEGDPLSSELGPGHASQSLSSPQMLSLASSRPGTFSPSHHPQLTSLGPPAPLGSPAWPGISRRRGGWSVGEGPQGPAAVRLGQVRHPSRRTSDTLEVDRPQKSPSRRYPSTGHGSREPLGDTWQIWPRKEWKFGCVLKNNKTPREKADNYPDMKKRHLTTSSLLRTSVLAKALAGAPLVGALSRCAKVEGSIPGQGTYKKQPMNAEISGTTNLSPSPPLISSLSKVSKLKEVLIKTSKELWGMRNMRKRERGPGGRASCSAAEPPTAGRCSGRAREGGTKVCECWGEPKPQVCTPCDRLSEQHKDTDWKLTRSDKRVLQTTQ